MGSSSTPQYQLPTTTSVFTQLGLMMYNQRLHGFATCVSSSILFTLYRLLIQIILLALSPERLHIFIQECLNVLKAHASGKQLPYGAGPGNAVKHA